MWRQAACKYAPEDNLRALCHLPGHVRASWVSPVTGIAARTRAGPATRAGPVPPRRTAPVLQRAGYNRPSVTSGRFRVPHPAHVMTVIGVFVQRFAVIRGLGAGGPVSDSRGCGRRYPWCIRVIVQVTRPARSPIIKPARRFSPHNPPKGP
jgi:hypothetical protein